MEQKRDGAGCESKNRRRGMFFVLKLQREDKEQTSDRNRCNNSTTVSSNIFKIPKIRLSRNLKRGHKRQTHRAGLPNSGPMPTTGIPTTGVAATPETPNPSNTHTHTCGEKTPPRPQTGLGIIS